MKVFKSLLIASSILVSGFGFASSWIQTEFMKLNFNEICQSNAKKVEAHGIVTVYCLKKGLAETIYTSEVATGDFKKNFVPSDFLTPADLDLPSLKGKNLVQTRAFELIDAKKKKLLGYEIAYEYESPRATIIFNYDLKGNIVSSQLHYR